MTVVWSGIEPDHGMEPGLAHHFFLQLLNGVVRSRTAREKYNYDMHRSTGIPAFEGRGSSGYQAREHTPGWFWYSLREMKL